MTIGASALGADAVGAGPAGQEVIYGLISAPSSLGAPAILARNGALIEGLISAPSPLGNVRMVAINDFTGLLDPHQPDRYVMDLLVDGARVRAPISSWQATLQTARANYVQAVIPAATPWIEAIQAAQHFAILRQSPAPSGDWIEHEMARAPLGQWTYDQGPQRATAMISGYVSVLDTGDTTASSYARPLPGLRSISISPSGVRARCAIDWLLRPGHRAIAGAQNFVVAYINYYVSANNAYCDVGERG